MHGDIVIALHNRHLHYFEELVGETARMGCCLISEGLSLTILIEHFFQSAPPDSHASLGKYPALCILLDGAGQREGGIVYGDFYHHPGTLAHFVDEMGIFTTQAIEEQMGDG